MLQHHAPRIYLSGDDADTLRGVFGLRCRRPEGQRPPEPRRQRAPKRGNSDELAKIREWANAIGHEVSTRGRTSQAVRDAHDAAH